MKPVLGVAWQPGEFAYLVALGRAGEPLVYSRLDELPPAARAMRNAYARFGIRSHVAQPLIVAGTLIGFLGFGSLRRERAWPSDLVARMRLLADIFAGALARKRAQEQLRESEARLDAMVRSAMDAIVAVDAERRIILFNAAAERMFGCSAMQAIGAPLDRLIPARPGATPTGPTNHGDHPSTSPSQTAMRDAWGVRADGTGFPLEASMSHATVDGRTVTTVIVRDITERVRAAVEIGQALAFERMLADLSTAMLSAPSLDVARVIPESLQAIGEFLRVERVSLWKLASGNTRSALLHTWCDSSTPPPPEALASAGATWLTARLQDGQVVRFARPEELSEEATAPQGADRGFGVRSLLAVPLWVDGRISASLALAMLGTERAWPDVLIPRVRLIGETLVHLLERDRRARQLADAQTEAAQFRDRLAHLVRVHTVGEMSAALAHEITQPLGAIENYAIAARSRVAEPSPDRAKVVELLDKVIRQATRAGDVVTRLRGLVRHHDYEPVEIDLEPAIRACVDLVKPECELRDIRIELRVGAALPEILADEILIQQVALNLLRNSLEAMAIEQPGVVRLIVVDVAADGADTVLVRVADRGAGIREGELAHVFEPFYSTKPTGLGIGLAICRKLIEAHGGRLWAEHRPGGGAVFQFTLPVRAADA